MPPAGFEPTIPASERPYTDALDRATVGIGSNINNNNNNNNNRYANISKVLKPPLNSMRQNDMKQVPYSEPQQIRRNRIGELAAGICTPLKII